LINIISKLCIIGIVKYSNADVVNRNVVELDASNIGNYLDFAVVELFELRSFHASMFEF
jgi:hypothetical protein